MTLCDHEWHDCQIVPSAARQRICSRCELVEVMALGYIEAATVRVRMSEPDDES